MANPLREAFAFDQFHRDVWKPARFGLMDPGFIDLRDARMAQSAQNQRLQLEPFFRSRPQHRLHDLQGDASARAFLFGDEDLGHAPFAQRLDDSILADLLRQIRRLNRSHGKGLAEGGRVEKRVGLRTVVRIQQGFDFAANVIRRHLRRKGRLTLVLG